MVLAATGLWAVENVIAKKVLATVEADLVVAARMGLGAILLLIAAQVKYPGALGQVAALSGRQWWFMGLTALMLLAYVMTWYRALQRARATLVATVLVGSTVITNVLSAVLTTHKWTATMGWQALIIGVGVGLFIKGDELMGRVGKLVKAS